MDERVRRRPSDEPSRTCRARAELLVAEPEPTVTEVVRLDFDEQSKGSRELPALSDVSTLAFDAKANELTGVTAKSSHERHRNQDDAPAGSARYRVTYVQDAQGSRSTRPPASGTCSTHEARNIVRVMNRRGSERRASRISLRELRTAPTRSAFNPTTGCSTSEAPNEHVVYAVDTSGTVEESDLSALGLRNPTGMTFAASADTTDPTARQNLFVAQAGDAQSLGGVTEVTLGPRRRPLRPSTRRSSRRSTPRLQPRESGPVRHRVPARLRPPAHRRLRGRRGHGRGLPRRQHVAVHKGRSHDRLGHDLPGVLQGTDGSTYDPGSNTLFISDDTRVGSMSSSPVRMVASGTATTSGRSSTRPHTAATTPKTRLRPDYGILYFSDAVAPRCTAQPGQRCVRRRQRS